MWLVDIISHRIRNTFLSKVIIKLSVFVLHFFDELRVFEVFFPELLLEVSELLVLNWGSLSINNLISCLFYYVAMIVPVFEGRPSFGIVFKQARFRLLDVLSQKGLRSDYFMVANVDIIWECIVVRVLSKVFKNV